MTLKETYEKYHPLGYTDRNIIVEFLSQPSELPTASKLISKILYTKINELQRFQETQLAWQMFPNDYLYKDYPSDVARKFDELIRKDIMGMDFSDDDRTWLAEHIPQMEKPKGVFCASLYYKILKNGYRFKDTTDKDVDTAEAWHTV